MSIYNPQGVASQGPVRVREDRRTVQPLLSLTPDLRAAIVRAYYCCREIGGRGRSDYEVQANEAADRIAQALGSLGTYV